MSIDQIEKIQVGTEKHEFHCDKCGKMLGISYVDKEGNYKNLGYNEWRYHVGHEWWHMEGHYCLSCATKINSSIIDAIKSIGFQKEID